MRRPRQEFEESVPLSKRQTAKNAAVAKTATKPSRGEQAAAAAKPKAGKQAAKPAAKGKAAPAKKYVDSSDEEDIPLSKRTK